MSWLADVSPEWPEVLRDDPMPDDFILDEDLGFDGKVKQNPEDFQVTEILADEPVGSGPNTFIRIQKREMSTRSVVQVLAEFLDRDPDDFCVADYKERQTVATQWISLEHLDPLSLEAFTHDKIEIIRLTRDEDKLEPQDLRANRYEVTIRDVSSDAEENARAGLDVLRRRGAPNWFGNQCFGYRETYHYLGWALIKKEWDWFLHELLNKPRPVDSERLRQARTSASQGDWERAEERFPSHFTAEREAVKSLQRYPDNHSRAAEVIPEDARGFYLRALQGFAFNKFLQRRLDAFDELVPGDVAFMHETSGCFPVMDPDDERHRLERFEISPTGPMYGEKFLGGSAEVEELEDRILEELDLSYSDFQRAKYPVQGRRRPLRVPILQSRIQAVDSEHLEVGFTLPQGSYATVVLEELMRQRFPLADEMNL